MEKHYLGDIEIASDLKQIVQIIKKINYEF